MRSAHSGLSSSLRTSIARTSRAKISASRESSIRGILWKTPASSVPPSVTRKWRCTCRLSRSPKVWMVNPLGMARWAESPCPAREHNEPLLGAVGTSDAGEPAFRIAAVKILLDHLLNDRSEKTVLPLKTTLILSQEPVEMMEEYPVKDRPLRMSRTIDSPHSGRKASRNGPMSWMRSGLPEKQEEPRLRSAIRSRKRQQSLSLVGGNGKRKGTDTTARRTILLTLGISRKFEKSTVENESEGTGFSNRFRGSATRNWRSPYSQRKILTVMARATAIKASRSAASPANRDHSWPNQSPFSMRTT